MSDDGRRADAPADSPAAGIHIAIALGSNLGDRRTHLDRALAHLRTSISSIVVSRYDETEPVGVGPQPRFLNAALTGKTALGPRALLDMLLAWEVAEGRERPFPGAPRTLDLDLIFYGDSIIDEPGLVVPHPRFRERLFVLEPLAEIAADWVDPVTGATVGELRRRAAVQGQVRGMSDEE
jgi:2-amino-4-hydroxy-6-hydroxymethyldihydropteridine diphosphokinase